MATAILIGGIATVLGAGWLMRRPDWRIASLLFALLAIPGNVDNLMPQMRLDPHDIANSTAPAVSFVDLLIAWGLLLTFREGRFAAWPPPARLIVAGATIVALMAATVTILNLAEGVEPSAGVRGILTFARVPALLGLALALRDQVRDGRMIAIAAALGVVALIGNGLYTSSSLDTSRFTAATFGRNGFSLALVLGALMTTGLAVELRRRQTGAPHSTWILALFVAAAALFGAIATGTRMSLLVAVPAVIGALFANRSWWHRAGVASVAAILIGVVLVAGAATLWTTEGARALSGWTDPAGTVDIITDPESEPDYSSTRTRTRWWSQAVELARTDPLTGIGPYQWNIRRYELEPGAEPIVADPHNTYIQMATEFGMPVLGGYLGFLVLLMAITAVSALKERSPVRRSAAAAALVAAALMIPVTEATNSYLFNVRIGAIEWLLLGCAAVLTVIPAAVAAHAPGDPSEGEDGSPWLDGSSEPM